MKNILILGAGRSGKTTISNLLKDKYPAYNLIHSDSLKWAIIRANGQEEFYRSADGIREQKLFENSVYFQHILLEFLKSNVRKDMFDYGHILESGQLDLDVVLEEVKTDDYIIVCLILDKMSADDIVNMCMEHDKETDWSYGLYKEILKEHAIDWVAKSQLLKEQCEKYGIPYFDMSKNRKEKIQEVLEYINYEVSL